MTVKELINELKKMPQNLRVATTSHDNMELEIQGFINDVEVRDFDEIRKKIGFDLDDQGLKGKMVILS